MRILSVATVGISLIGCTPGNHPEATFRAHHQSEALSEADLFEGKHITVAGYLHVTPEWWNTAITESPRGGQCLNLGGVEFLQKNKALLNGKRVVLPGTFHADAFKGALHGCESDAGLMTKNAEIKAAVCMQFSKLPDCQR